MTDPGMVERVARALATQANPRWEHMPDLPPDIETKLTIGAKVQWRILARAALLAMRDPSDGMVEAGRSLPNPEYGRILTLPKHLRLIWQAMIDAALGGGGE